MRKRYIPFAVALFFLPLMAQADMMPDGYHSVQTCFHIDNYAAYNEERYDFFLSGVAVFPWTEEMTNGSFCLGRAFDGTLIAVRRDQLSQIVRDPRGSEEEGSWPMKTQNQNLIVKSDMQLSATGPISDVNPLVGTDVTLHIDSMSGNSMAVHRVSTPAAVEQPAAQTTSSVSADTALPYAAFAVLAGVIGLLAGYVMWGRRSS